MSKITMISYPAGFSGEFLCTHIHQSPAYKPKPIVKSPANQYDFKCNEILNNYKSKKLNNENFTIGKETFELVNDGYNYCLPSHWYRKPVGDVKKFFNCFVRIFTHDPKLIRISYALWFLKTSFQKDPNVKDFGYKEWFRWTLNEKALLDPIYHQFDLEGLVYGNYERRRLEKLLDCYLDDKVIDDYAQKNYELLKMYGINISTDEEFIESINKIRKKRRNENL